MLTPMDINGLTVVALLVLLVAVVWHDMTTHRIENVSVLAIILLGLFSQLLGDGAVGVVNWLGGMAVGLGFLLPFYIGGGMAAGDVKLLAAIGSVLGPIPTVLAGGVTLLTGAALGMFVLYRHKPVSDDKSGVGQESPSAQHPHQAPAVLPRRKERLPYAAAIAAGAIGGLIYSGRLSEFLGALV